jgi:hypothetical protein
MPLPCYLDGPVDYETYGVPLASGPQVIRASQLIDHFLRRPEGCVYKTDANGQPAYMAFMTPSATYTSSAPIVAGASVTVPLPNYVGDNDSLVGESVLLDRLVPSVTEVCVIASVTNQVMTLNNVQFTHTASPNPVTLELGLTITEEKQFPSQRSITKLAQWPIAQLISGVGRYGYGRRTDQEAGYFYDLNLLTSVQALGGPPAWTSFAIPASSLNPTSGDLWIPGGQLLAPFTDVKVRYVGGWPSTGYPPDIKVACAMIVSALEASPLGPQIKRFNAGKTTIERFTDSVMDRDVKSILRPFMANWMV